MGGNKKTGFLSMATAYWCIGIALTNQTGSWSECVLGCHVGAMCSAELSTCIISHQCIVNTYIGVRYKWFTCGWRTRADVWLQLRLCASMYTTKLQPERLPNFFWQLWSQGCYSATFNSQFVHTGERGQRSCDSSSLVCSNWHSEGKNNGCKLFYEQYHDFVQSWSHLASQPCFVTHLMFNWHLKA